MNSANSIIETRSTPVSLEIQQEMRPCPYCHELFAPKRKAQAFCGSKCRSAYHIDVGTLGQIRSVHKLLRGRVSVVIHLEGPAAEAALNLPVREQIRIVRQA